jgi:hypothetical protein
MGWCTYAHKCVPVALPVLFLELLSRWPLPAARQSSASWNAAVAAADYGTTGRRPFPVHDTPTEEPRRNKLDKMPGRVAGVERSEPPDSTTVGSLRSTTATQTCTVYFCASAKASLDGFLRMDSRDDQMASGENRSRYPQHDRTSRAPTALAKPVAHNLTPFRQCHPPVGISGGSTRSIRQDVSISFLPVIHPGRWYVNVHNVTVHWAAANDIDFKIHAPRGSGGTDCSLAYDVRACLARKCRTSRIRRSTSSAVSSGLL